jgi:hypothetical protein
MDSILIKSYHPAIDYDSKVVYNQLQTDMQKLETKD